jgi:hypothetical protein
MLAIDVDLHQMESALERWEADQKTARKTQANHLLSASRNFAEHANATIKARETMS